MHFVPSEPCNSVRSTVTTINHIIINMTEAIGSFPFGRPVLKVCQKDRTQKKVFVLGVYASAVHAQWVDKKDALLIRAVAVDSEPEIFWRGDGAEKIIKGIELPPGAGRLLPPSEKLNGPSGLALDSEFLDPLALIRKDVWLCDLVPYSCRNPAQDQALRNKYKPLEKPFSLPDYSQWKEVPKVLADDDRIHEILDEFRSASPEIIITLGDQPLKWFVRKVSNDRRCKLADYGETDETYGRLHDIEIEGRKLLLLPLVHPRQAAKLGRYSPVWFNRHDEWKKTTALSIKSMFQDLQGQYEFSWPEQ